MHKTPIALNEFLSDSTLQSYNTVSHWEPYRNTTGVDLTVC